MRYHIDVGGLPGRPDAVLRAAKVATFAHGCFWHHHEGCRHGRLPDTVYPWAKKFGCTRARDAAARATLIDAGSRVVWVWECGLVGPDALPGKPPDETIAGFLKGDAPFLEIAGSGVVKPGHGAATA
jgi:DNA mismatch endonuclease (patch repair protein)